MKVPTPPDDFETLSADDKARWIRDTLIETTRHDPVFRPELSMAKPWVMAPVVLPRATLAKTFDRTEDLMEDGRPKVIHTQGAVAMIDFEPADNSPFTGVLASPANGGGARGLLRMSLAVPPVGTKAVTPGFGLKLFIDGAPSLDLLAMNHTVGQGRDYNLFSNTFTHDLTEEHKELRLPQRILQLAFRRVNKNPRSLRIDHFAAIKQCGTAIAQPVAPHRLVFRPHRDVAKLFRGKHGEDYRETLERIPPGAVLYDLEAVEPKDVDGSRGSNTAAGRIVVSDRFTSSHGGDRLFFRHMVQDDDRKDR